MIHRDLKPANIKVTPDGKVKVLDFGLAKAFSGDETEANLANSPTLSMQATQQGVILGTAAYMSPEQARGQEVDARTDIWAFGVILYEILTGRTLFDGGTVSDTLADVLRADVDWSVLPDGLGHSIHRLLRRCLRKDRNNRLHAMADARLELADAEEPAPADTVAPPATSRFGWLAAALVLIVASFAAGLWQTGADAPTLTWRGELLGGPPVALGPRVSPNGEMIAFEAMVNGMTQVGIMQLQSGRWEILTADRSRGIIRNLAWAPDGSGIYFDRYLDVPAGIFRVEVVGGNREPRTVLDDAMAPEPLSDGSLIVVRLNEERQWQLFRFRPETGESTGLNGILPPETGRNSVRATRDGEAVLFFGKPLDDPTGENLLYELDLGSGAARPLLDSALLGPHPRFFPLALTREGGEALLEIASGDLHRIVTLARSDPRGLNRLLELPGLPTKIDVGIDGAIYADQWEQPSEILILDAGTQVTGRIAVSNRHPQVESGPLPLQDGRILMTLGSTGGRRVMAIAGDGTYAPFLETREETGSPMARVGPESVALMLGSPPNQLLALASTVDGSIRRRFDAIAGSEIRSVAGSPDGRTLYYAAGGEVWAMDLDTGAGRILHPGHAVAVDPSGEYAVVAVSEQAGTRLVKVVLADGGAEDILNRSEFALAEEPIESNAIAPDGRIAVAIAPDDLWFWPTGILDPQTGQIEKAWPDIDTDMFAGWDAGGNLIAVSHSFNGRLWRFTVETE